MKIEVLLHDIRAALDAAFEETDRWFDRDAALRTFKPANGGWTIDQVLEHIALTNHFLLILIDKGATKALKNVQQEDLQAVLANYTFQKDKLTEVGLHQSFPWMRPEHMEPKGEKTPAEVRAQLAAQLAQCHDVLGRLKNGEGVLYKTTMTVNALGKIDVYEYIFFLAQHARRHITQMEKVEASFR